MKAFFSKKNSVLGFLGTSVTVGIATAVVGCGSASNNDQGTSVTSLGYFQAAGVASTTGTSTLPAGLSGAYVRLGEILPEGISTTPVTGAGVGPDGSFIAYVGFQNNLTQEGATITRVGLDFTIPGGMKPPSTSVPVTIVMGPSVSSGTTTTSATNPFTGTQFNSSLPPGFANIPNRGYAQTFLVPSSVTAWMNLNRAQLPEPPFQLEVTSTGFYRTTSGNYQQTSSETFPVMVLPETVVVPAQATASGSTGTTGSSTSTGNDTVTDGTGTTDGTDTSLSTTGEDTSTTDTTSDGSSSDL